MTVCLFVCLLAGLRKYIWLDLPEKQLEDGSCSNLDPIKFGSDLDHLLDIK